MSGTKITRTPRSVQPGVNAGAIAAQSTVATEALESFEPSMLVRRTPKDIPITLDSEAARQAISKSEAYLRANGTLTAGMTITPVSVNKDQLGMVHVRMDVQFKGIKVWAGQVATHLDRNGNVSFANGGPSGTIPESVLASPPTSPQDALKLAQEKFRAEHASSKSKSPIEPTISNVEKMIAQNEKGEYVPAYYVRLTALEQDPPADMRYLINASTGAILTDFNKIDAIIHKHNLEAAQRDLPPMKKVSAEPAQRSLMDAGHMDFDPAETAPPEPRKLRQLTLEDAEGAELADKGTRSRKVTFSDSEPFTVGTLKLSLDLDHTWPGDVVIKLTSPKGKSVTVWNRKPGALTDLKGSVELPDFEGHDLRGDWKLTISDRAGKDIGLLNSWSLAATELNTKNDKSMYRGMVDVTAAQQADGSWKLEDKSRGKGVFAKDGLNKARPMGSKDITDANNIFGEVTDDPRTYAGVDAFINTQAFYDVLKECLGRDSIDGKGEALIANIHIGRNMVNAFWDGVQYSAGDGDNRNATALVNTDVVGHEFAHGLTQRTSNLIYSGESGALNESFSDIVGKLIEWKLAKTDPDAPTFPWGVGEQLWTAGKPGDALRYMDDPKKDNYSVDHYSEFNKQPEVHGSSGILNKAFHLLVEGGVNKTGGYGVDVGIGMEKAAMIAMRANTMYWTPNQGIPSALALMVKAAKDLYGEGSQEVKSTEQMMRSALEKKPKLEIEPPPASTPVARA